MAMRGNRTQESGLWGWAGSGMALGLLTGLVAFAPARWVAATVQQASNQQVTLVNARGTLWQGSAQLVFSGGAGSQDAVELPGLVHWTIAPHWQSLGIQIAADCCTPQPLDMTVAPAGWGITRLHVQDGQSNWPASLLTGLGTPWNTVQPMGQLQLSSKSLVLEWAQGRATLVGSVQLDAIGISSRLSTLQPMGSYRVTLQGGTTTTLQLATLEGSLQLSGQGQWLGQSLRFEGEARAAADRIDALTNLLNIIGRRDGARSIIKVG